MNEANEPAPAPTWDTADPARGLLRYAEWLNAEARRQFLEAGTHVELVFLLGTEGLGGLVTPPPGMPREDFAAALRNAVQEHHLYGVLHVAEAWAYVPDRAADHTLMQLIDGELAVRDLQPGDRTETLMVHLQSRDRAQKLWLHPIQRTGGQATLGEARVFDGPVRGRLGDLFAT